MKRCAKCKTEKDLSLFSRSAKTKDGRHAYCKDCAYLVHKEWVEANPSRVKEYARNWWLEKAYDLSVEEYEQLLQISNGACHICGITDPGTSRHNIFYVDHCHETGRIRGLLCAPCNFGLGHFKSNPDLLRQAAIYLEKGL